MSDDDLGNRGPHDRSRINVKEPHELRDWTKQLGVTAPQWRSAVQAVGVSVSDVRTHLGKK